MKRFMICALALAGVLTAGRVSAQDKGVSFSGGSDLVSAYVWRGVTQAGVSLQPTLTMTAGKFSATAWGSVDFASTSYKEMDLTLAYALGPVTLSLADLYWEGGAGDRGLVNGNDSTFDGRSPHRVELGASWVVLGEGSPYAGPGTRFFSARPTLMPRVSGLTVPISRWPIRSA